MCQSAPTSALPNSGSPVDAVIYAYGAGSDRRLEIPGEHLPGSIAAAELVTWYCGHPDVHPDTDQPSIRDYLVASEIDELIRTSRQAVVVGIGNVALDVARVLIKTVDELDDTDMADEVLESLARKHITDVHVLGRRGPAYTAFTTKELREMGQLADVDVIIEPADLELDPSSQAVVQQNKVAARNLAVLQEWAARPLSGASRRISFHFWSRPTMIIGNDRVTAVEVERTMINSDGFVVGIGRRPTLPADLVVRSVGYRGLPLPGIPFDEGTGRVPHAEGRRDSRRRILTRRVRDWLDQARPNWGDWHQQVRRRGDGHVSVGRSAQWCGEGARAIGTSRPATRAAGGIHALGMPAWRRIDAAEVELGATHGRLRTTLAHRRELLAAANARLTILTRHRRP